MVQFAARFCGPPTHPITLHDYVTAHLSRSNGGGSMNLLPMASITYFCIASTSLSGRMSLQKEERGRPYRVRVLCMAVHDTCIYETGISPITINSLKNHKCTSALAPPPPPHDQ